MPPSTSWPVHRKGNCLLSVLEFYANTDASNHAGLMFFSDHGTPDGWIHEHGYGCHTFKWYLLSPKHSAYQLLIVCRVNKDGKFVYIKYHFLAETGQKQLTEPEAIRISGEDPDYSKRQLWDAIEEGKEIVWKAHVQIMEPDEADANKLGFDPFDVTKVWPRGQFPVLSPNAHSLYRLTASDA